MKREKEFGETNKYDTIRYILKNYSNREKPIGIKAISGYAKEMGVNIKRSAIEGFMDEMIVRTYETDEEVDEYLAEWSAEDREIYFCKTSKEGRRTRGYWMLETISDSEWLFIIDSVLNSKILTKKETDNLTKRLLLLAGKNVSALTSYRNRMMDQPYFVGDDIIDDKIGHIESSVLKKVQLIRNAINEGKKVKFTLNTYQYGNQEVRLVPYGKSVRICSPYEVIYSNGRYYMVGADLDTERSGILKYKLYRIDLMTDVSVTRATATTKEAAGIDLSNLYKYRLENPYMYSGEVKEVQIRVDADQLTQIVDWFSDDFRVVGLDADEDAYYDIEVKVNLNSFTFWILQYSGCVEVLDTGKKNDESYRNHIKETLRKALEKYEEDESNTH